MPKRETSAPPSMSLEEIAAACGVAISTVHGWCEREGLESRRAGRKRLVPTAALLKFLAHRPGSSVGSQRERLAKEQADKAALDNAVRRKDLIYTADVSVVFNEAIRMMRSEIDGTAGRIANELAAINDPGAVRARLLEDYRAACAAFAERLRELAQQGHPDVPGSPRSASVGVITNERNSRKAIERPPLP
jgi:hypothetical protein